MSGTTTHRSKTWSEISVGETASLRRLCIADDLVVFAHASGNLNPINLPDSDPATVERAPAMWVGSLISSVLGNVLPGAGTVYRAQTLTFHAPAREGDELVIGVRVREKRAEPDLVLDTWVDRADGTRLCDGEAVVAAPAAAILYTTEEIPGLIVQRHVHFERFIHLAEALPPLATAVVAPEEPVSLGGALLAARHNLISPILVGDRRAIEAAAREGHLDIAGIPVVDAPRHGDAAARAVAMVHEGAVAAIMKGHLHTDELLRHVVKSDGGLRTSRRLSHVFVMDVPGLGRPLLITDSAINIAPDLEAKVDIVQNAIDLAHALGIAMPRVAILSAVETVNPKIPSTIDAAVLAKMAERGQISGGDVDGPLAMDNAVNLGAARTKGLKGFVAGSADVLVAPNLEAGNMIVKQLTFMAHAEAGGIVLGAAAPVILTSRADDERVRLGSCAIAALARAAASRPALAAA
jgi:phosphate butyryltransferase